MAAPDPAFNRWRETFALLEAFRTVACPSPGLSAILQARQDGQLGLRDTPAKRRPQIEGFAELLRHWILG